jgi:alpha-beta hydrolase superfamily lysophospholipase
MTRRSNTLVAAAAVAAVAASAFAQIAWERAVRHETITFHDASRDNRPVAVDITVRRDRELQANAGMIKLPVAILNHGNTVKFTEYSFLANVFAARGYIVASIQHDLATDAPLVTKVGELYVGRLPQYRRGIANIRFAIDELRKVQPNADYDHLTMVGHSNGGDISMYFARMYPDQIKKVVTLDNLRVPFVTDGKIRILSFRSKDPVFKADPGVVPNDEVCAKAGIEVVKTQFQHNDLSDRGPEQAKAYIEAKVHRFLDEVDQDDDNPFKILPTTSADAGAVTEAQPPAAASAKN